MAYQLMDISKLFDPFIECGDHLFVNRKKKAIITMYLIIYSVTVLVLFLILINGYAEAAFSLLLITTPVLGLACYSAYAEKNPVLVIDKNGITLEGRFYPWDTIGSVKLEKYQTRWGYYHILFYLKNRKTVRLTVNDLLDQPLKVIAAYILKLQPDQSKL